MIRRLLALLVVLWAFGFLWFAVSLPQPAGGERTDAIVVPTGSGGRIPRGLALLNEGAARRMLVTGVYEDVRPNEFAAEYRVPPRLMECCVTLGFAALDTRGNARETATWVAANEVRSIRLVTADWHMRRAALELDEKLPDGISVMRDAVRSEPSLWILFLEYHKLLATWLVQLLGDLWPG
ncbi:MAG TPA: YdcF family protein [Croceibacterium sp.]|nr:YdcF family protein [Croceibacterium sp.]